MSPYLLVPLLPVAYLIYKYGDELLSRLTGVGAEETTYTRDRKDKVPTYTSLDEVPTTPMTNEECQKAKNLLTGMQAHLKTLEDVKKGHGVASQKGGDEPVADIDALIEKQKADIAALEERIKKDPGCGEEGKQA